MNKKKESIKYIKVTDDTIKLPEKQGNGTLKYSVRVDKNGNIARYSFAYINFHIYTGDNGRVLGYDNCHGYHHRHYMGKENKIVFSSFEDVLDHFEKEWGILHETVKIQKAR
ncbi:MAG: transcriptional regulator [Gammaproteobacteria bacterium]|jgi:hypothetical protein|nr:transcriptional regulator [Gammaproteobacteria bacterium]MCE3238651.1 transcriptional regulator [Gammaproteobacteria bacterium]